MPWDVLMRMNRHQRSAIYIMLKEQDGEFKFDDETMTWSAIERPQ